MYRNRFTKITFVEITPYEIYTVVFYLNIAYLIYKCHTFFLRQLQMLQNYKITNYKNSIFFHTYDTLLWGWISISMQVLRERIGLLKPDRVWIILPVIGKNIILWH